MKWNPRVSLLTGLAAAVLLAQPVGAATPEQIEDSIARGLDWLATQQQSDGSWLYAAGAPSYCQDIATTALAVVKFEDRARELGLDPFDPGQYEYAQNVIDGLDYIFAYAISDANGVYLPCLETYNTGTALMAVSASGAPDRLITTGPLAGSDYQSAAAGMVAWLSAAQNRTGDMYDCDVGGWGYSLGYDGFSDQSNSGYATLGLGFAAGQEGFALTIPADVLSRLSLYIDNVQDPVDGDSYDGGSWYEPCSNFKWVNILKTGNLLYELALVGDDPATSQRIQDAVDYIEAHWNAVGPQPEFPATSLGWRDAYQAMYTMMKGLESLRIGMLNIGGSDVDWFDEVSDVIVANQAVDGSMNALTTPPYGEGETSANLRTVWALLTLERVVDIPKIEVPVDVHPTSCPNPVNVGSKGLTPVAILGTETFDVSTVDPATVMLQGIAPIRWAIEDVATPYEPFLGKEGPYACNTDGPDGYFDLTLKFETQALAEALGVVYDRAVVVVTLTGSLKEEFGGTQIVGEDVVIILKKGK
jgi:hypothetical protein